MGKEKKNNKVKNFFGSIAKYFKDFGIAVAKGDLAVKASLVVMGAGYIARKQVVKGILITIIEVLYIILMVGFGAPYLAKFDTLGDTQFAQEFDPLTMQTTTNDYDNSFSILLYSIVALFITFCFVMYWIHNVKAAYKLQLMKENGEHINTFKEDVKEMLGKKFYITLLSLPTIGVILMNILPILVMIAIAFTNYDQNHLPPSALFTWVGFTNFKSLFTNSLTVSFGYAFRKIIVWTFLWAILATFTTFMGGIFLAKLLNKKTVKLPRMWRTLFIIAIAVPQFVTLLLVRNFFADTGIVNTICSNIGLTDFLKSIGLVSANLSYIPFLTSSGWAKVMIVLINIWVGVPYQMLVATGVLMNVPEDQIESARIDGATSGQIFRKITMPYVLQIQGPSLLTDFIKNINNFNVIYLLTQDVFITQDQALANSNAKEVDLLVTWLFRLTNEYYNYKMASVIGIIVFIICAVFSIITYRNMISGDKEEVYQ